MSAIDGKYVKINNQSINNRREARGLRAPLQVARKCQMEPNAEILFLTMLLVFLGC